MKTLHGQDCQLGKASCGKAAGCMNVFEAKNARITIRNPDGTVTVLQEFANLTYSLDYEPQVDIFDDRDGQ